MPHDSMSKQQISEQQNNILFVQAVQKHPSLYNFELPSYSRKDISDQAWEEVSKVTNMTPSACRERWRNLRAVFMRTMKAPPKSTGKKKPYYLADVMEFVKPFLRPIAQAEAAKQKEKHEKEDPEKPVQIQVEQIKVELETSSDSDEREWYGSADDDTMSGTRKRPAPDEELQQTAKIARVSQPSSSTSTVAHESEHVKSFLNSLLPELNEMNLNQFKNFKRKVLLLIDSIMTDIPPSPRRYTDHEYTM